MKNKLNGGLNGLFGRWLKKALFFVVDNLESGVNTGTSNIFKSFVSQLAVKANNLVMSIGDGGSTFWQRAPQVINPTAVEENILDQWLQNKFMPFYSNLLVSVDRAFLGFDLKAQKTKANAELLKMCVLREYYLVNETTGLSQDAISTRLELINELFKPVEDLIFSKLGNPVLTTSVANQSYFGNLLSSNVDGETYSCKQYVGASTITVNPIDKGQTIPSKSTVPKLDIGFVQLPTLPSTATEQDSGNGTKPTSSWTWLTTLSAASVLLTAYQILKKDKPKK